MSEQEGPKKTYRGNCHCKAYVYETTVPEIKSATNCNCSICTKKGNVYISPGADNIKFVKGEQSTLSVYKFNTSNFNHHFCPTCGTSVLIEGKFGDTPMLVINARTLQDVDVWSLEIKTFDGANFPGDWKSPEFTGEEPKADIEGGKIYYGSCHCGAVKLALKSKPLDSTYKDQCTECNCSSCNRIGATWVYPFKEQVVYEGEENLVKYTFNNHSTGKGFCKNCGVFVGQFPVALTEEQKAHMQPEAVAYMEGATKMAPVNLKCFPEVDLADMKPFKFDGWNKIQKPYVNP